MAKYCNKCGAALRDDARFCESCGSKVPEAAPPRRFCSSCGKELPADAAFCRFCGAQVQNSARRSSRNDTPAGQTAVNRPAQTAVPPYREPVPQTQPAKTKPKKKGRGLSLFLSLAIAVEFCIAGFKYPGFLRREGVDVTDDSSGYSSGITLQYTKKQIDDAPAKSVDVSPWEPVADFGQVKVELDAWSLNEESDTLTVRELPELSEGGEDGWIIQGYDFSLASGQDEFATDITITLPRTHPGSLSGCVWYNEETGMWENVYFEVSEDESSYLVYTDHFSKYGVKRFQFNPETMTLAASDSGMPGLNDGVFVEVQEKGVNRMQWRVEVDYERMWRLYQKKTDEDIQKLCDTLQAVMQEGDEYTDSQSYLDGLETYHNLVGETDSVKGVLTLPSELSEYILENKVKPEITMLDKFLIGYDTLMTTLKICAEAKRGNHSPEKILMNMPKAAMNHKGDIAGIAVTAVSVTYLAPWLAALVGVTWWTAGKLYDFDTGNAEFTDPTLETIHQYFCSLRTTEMVYGEAITDKKVLGKYLKQPKQRVPMEQLPSMTEEDFTALKKTVAAHPLRRYPDETAESATAWYDWLLGKEEQVQMKYEGWAEALKTILRVCADNNPVYLETVLDEFYWNYAYSFWRLDEENILDVICYRFWSSSKEDGSEGTLTSMKAVNKGKPVTGADKKRCAEDFVRRLKSETKPILMDVLETMQRENFCEMMKEMDNKILPLFNCKLVFHVTDENLPAGASFQNSMYCKDWTTINSNQYYVRNYADKGFDKKEFITPMRFDAAKEACFLPLLPSYKVTEEAGLLVKNSVKNYYPYTTDFVPRPEEKGDVVYRCTYFHYLMMGAPTVMFFKDVSKMSAAADEKEIPGKIVLPDLAKAVTRKVVNKYTNKTYKVTEMVPVKKADVQVTIPRSVGTVFKFFDLNYYYFDSGSDAATMMLVYLEEALKTMEITLAADGSFSVTGSALYENNTPRHDINDSIFPEVEVLYGEDVFDPVWEESGIYDSLHADLNGKVDLKSGTGSASLTANLSGSSYYRMGDTKGKVESSSTSTSASLEGVTPYVTVTNSGRELTIRFVSSGEDRLSFSYTTTHSSSPADSGKEDWDLTIVYRSVK
ncbi:MAG: zinc ribbon domain-containing protein [Clostridiales bacterium]|nr:zinc ribbon domain-containing protein [Clostridiales bacterium]